MKLENVRKDIILTVEHRLVLLRGKMLQMERYWGRRHKQDQQRIHELSEHIRTLKKVFNMMESLFSKSFGRSALANLSPAAANVRRSFSFDAGAKGKTLQQLGNDMKFGYPYTNVLSSPDRSEPNSVCSLAIHSTSPSPDIKPTCPKPEIPTGNINVLEMLPKKLRLDLDRDEQRRKNFRKTREKLFNSMTRVSTFLSDPKNQANLAEFHARANMTLVQCRASNLYKADCFSLKEVGAGLPAVATRLCLLRNQLLIKPCGRDELFSLRLNPAEPWEKINLFSITKISHRRAVPYPNSALIRMETQPTLHTVNRVNETKVYKLWVFEDSKMLLASLMECLPSHIWDDDQSSAKANSSEVKHTKEGSSTSTNTTEPTVEKSQAGIVRSVASLFGFGLVTDSGSTTIQKSSDAIVQKKKPPITLANNRTPQPTPPPPPVVAAPRAKGDSSKSSLKSDVNKILEYK